MAAHPTFDAEQHDDLAVVRVRSLRLRDAEIAALVEWMVRTEGVGARGPLALDLSQVQLMSSTAIAVLARVAETRELHLIGLQPLLQETFDLLGLTQVLRCHETYEAALAAVAAAPALNRSA